MDTRIEKGDRDREHGHDRCHRMSSACAVTTVESAAIVQAPRLALTLRA